MTLPYQPLTDMERRQILHHAVLMETSQGNRVAWVGEFEAHIWRQPAPINHVVHAVLSLLTFGLWLFVWLLVVALQPRAQLVGVAVDEHGTLYNFNAQPPATRSAARPHLER